MTALVSAAGVFAGVHRIRHALIWRKLDMRPPIPWKQRMVCIEAKINPEGKSRAWGVTHRVTGVTQDLDLPLCAVNRQFR